jgi:hypothetical protein
MTTNFEHTGILATFQLKRTNVTPAADRLAALEAWVTTFDERLSRLESALLGNAKAVEGK